MAQKKKKGPQPKSGTQKRKKSRSQIIFEIVAIFMVLTMVVPYLLSLFR